MTDDPGEKSYCIHEVHYDETGRILGWTKNRSQSAVTPWRA
jgi:hypothetical protein